jgi:hypothetical protein
MKKRKPPIIAFTLLILFGAVAAAFNYKSGLDPKAEAQQAAQQVAEAHVGDPRPPSDSKSTAAKVQAQMGGPTAPKSASTGPMHGPKGRMGPNGPGGNPLMVPKGMNQRPVPNESAVSSQWYHQDSAKPAGG